jgi:septum formation protein
MSSAKPSIFSILGRAEAPNRETLRRTLAKQRSAAKKGSERPKLVLASASPRRLLLLSQVGITPDALRPTSIDETPKRGEMPRTLASRLARAKAEAGRDQLANDTALADSYVLAADTVVAVGRRILMKPNHVEEAVEALQQLSGRDTRVRFKRLSAAEIEAYVASREWHGKAGGYAIQGLAGCFAQKIIGSFTNVVGLPLAEVTAMLIGENFPVHYNWVQAADADPA